MKVQFRILDCLSVCGFVALLFLGCNSTSTQDSESTPSVSAANGDYDWAGFLGPNQDGISGEKGVRTDWADGNLPVLWTRDLGEGYAPGVAVGNRYYHFDRGIMGARLVCLNAANGELVWEFVYASNYVDMYGYDSGPRSCPVLDDEMVYLYGVEGKLHALDSMTGDVKWDQDLNKKFGVHQNFFGVSSPPVVFKDKLLVMVGGSPADNQIRKGQLDNALPNGTAIVALDKKTGEVLYEIGDDLASYTAIKVVEYEGREWAFAWARGSLIAFDPNNGQIDFEFPWRAKSLESVNASTPVVFDGHVFLSECYSIGSVLLKFGEDLDGKHEVVWKDEGREKSMMTHWNTAIYHEGYLYGSSGRHKNGASLRCVDAKTGKVQWSKDGLTRCNMTFVDGHLAVMAEHGQLMLIKCNPKKFDLVSRYDSGDGQHVEFKEPSWAAPVIANGRMFVRGKDNLVCFELKSQ
jgi:prepilin-type processing-associated H-X9-DG protein